MESSMSGHVTPSNPGTAAVPRRKAPRKSRSKGLRTKTGCITCRKRHKKCNETQALDYLNTYPPKESVPSATQQPNQALLVCGNCASTGRTCIWPDQVQMQRQFDRNNNSQELTERSQDSTPHGVTGPHRYLASEEISQPRPQIASPFANHVSPSGTVSSEFLTADLASVRWLDLLAADALQANRGFTRPSSPSFEDATPAPNSLSSPADVSQINVQAFAGASNSSTASENFPWQLEKDIVLKNEEVPIFRNFVEHSSLWLDLFDPDNHFSVYTLRLALRNTGLMKSILALSAQHLSRQGSRIDSDAPSDPNLAVQYYYETLHYVQTALQYNSYAHSEELLATALIISTYEMLDESQSGWQRHLKGVFWIQRSQDVDGGSGGIRQAVWWAWLRQDVWAAFRERRRCLSFWRPVKDYPELNQPELILRATYLFSQAVNYCADPGNKANLESVQQRMESADELLAMLDRWKSFLGDDFKPLPVAETGSIFQPLWIHPPQLGVALQLFYFARILITLHRPTKSGFNSYLKVQKVLSDAVAMICGIALELRDEGCQIISAQCLYGAGLCVQDTAQRNQIISLITACEARTGWPMSTLREDLRQEWKKGDSDEDKEARLLT